MAEAGQQRSPREENLFNRLLAFLNSNQSEEGMAPEQLREQRGLRYEQIRRKQIRLFAWRGSPTPELLADRTFDRVMGKLDAVNGNYEGDPAHYVASVGRYIFQESLREQSTPEIPPKVERSEEDELARDCLDTCMEELLEPKERKLIVEYYQGEKRAKIDHRQEIARRHGLSVNALRIECCRIRGRLQECVFECMNLK